jgi:hypothetical protein
MSDAITHEAFQAVRDLIVAGLVAFAYQKAKAAVVATGLAPALLKGLGWCSAIAIFAAVTLGAPSCEDGDPLNGSCSSYADDGFTPSQDRRYATGLFWLILLYAPLIAGALSVPDYRRGSKTPPSID